MTPAQIKGLIFKSEEDYPAVGGQIDMLGLYAHNFSPATDPNKTGDFYKDGIDRIAAVRDSHLFFLMSAFVAASEVLRVRDQARKTEDIAPIKEALSDLDKTKKKFHSWWNQQHKHPEMREQFDELRNNFEAAVYIAESPTYISAEDAVKEVIKQREEGKTR